MIRYFLIYIFLALQCNLWSQSSPAELKEYLKGNWFFFESNQKDSICEFDSAYIEIAFFDTHCSLVDDCYQSFVDHGYELDNEFKITLFTNYDSTIFLQGEIDVLDSFRFQLIHENNKMTFTRILEDEYKMTEYLNDFKRLDSLELDMPKPISKRFKYEGQDYYFSCLKRREMWERLVRGEISKKEVIQWAEQMILHCDTDFEAKEYEIYSKIVDEIFSD